jgi:hypothetical protein
VLSWCQLYTSDFTTLSHPLQKLFWNSTTSFQVKAVGRLIDDPAELSVVMFAFPVTNDVIGAPNHVRSAAAV